VVQVAACLCAYAHARRPSAFAQAQQKPVGASLSSPVRYLRLSLSRLVLPCAGYNGPNVNVCYGHCDGCDHNC